MFLSANSLSQYEITLKMVLFINDHPLLVSTGALVKWVISPLKRASDEVEASF